MRFRSFLLPIVTLLIIGGFVLWFLTPSRLPGEAVVDFGREHIDDAAPDPTYNSNPPTSGSHSPVWTNPGFYETEKNDRHLLHSLEHGYVVIAYNCAIKVQSSKFKVQSDVLAHEGEEEATESVAEGEEATGSAGVGDPSIHQPADSGQACHELTDYLKDLVKRFGEWKIIVVPRSKNDTRIALTAWGRIDKFNSLDKRRIERFVKAWRDKGPEATED